MQKGSSGKSDTQTMQQHTQTLGGGSTNYAPWIGQTLGTLATHANNMILGPNGTPLTGADLVAGFNPDQQSAFQMARGTAKEFGAGNTGNDTFQALLGQGIISPDAWKEHMNPYLDSVGRDAVNSMRREHDNTQAALSARYAARGGLGGSGEGFARARLARGFNEAVPGVISNIMSAGYDRAQGIAAQNAQNALAAAGLYDRNRTSELDRQMGATGLLGQAGSAQQQHAQRQIDAPYDITSWFQGFVPQVYDASQTSWGVQDTQGTQTSPNKSPSLFQQLLGAGLTVAGLPTSSGGSVGGNLLSSILGK